MKGIINKGFQELVLAQLGSEAWGEIKKIAGIHESFFSASENYPDTMTNDLAQATSQIFEMPLQAIWVEFGKFWMTQVAPKTYPSLMRLAGKSPKEFLLNMNHLHRHVIGSNSNATPPTFEYEEMPNGGILIHYHSKRNLCSVLKGLIQGVGLHFRKSLSVREVACVSTGSPCCIMEVTFHDS